MEYCGQCNSLSDSSVSNRIMEQITVWSALRRIIKMIYIKVPKEITEYETRLFLGLTKKQLCYFACGIVAGIVLGIIITPLFGTNALAVVITLVCVPVVALAFTDKDGIPMDIYVRYVIDFYRTKQKIPYGNIEVYQNKGDEKYDRKQKAKKRKKARAQKKLLENGLTKKEARKALCSKHTAVH